MTQAQSLSPTVQGKHVLCRKESTLPVNTGDLNVGIPRQTGVILGIINVLHAKLLQSCLTLCDPMNSSLPGSSIHGIIQARILEWVASSFSRGSS